MALETAVAEEVPQEVVELLEEAEAAEEEPVVGAEVPKVRLHSA